MNCLYHHYFFLLPNVRTLFTRLLTVGYDSPWPLWAVRLRKEPVQYWHFFFSCDSRFINWYKVMQIRCIFKWNNSDSSGIEMFNRDFCFCFAVDFINTILWLENNTYNQWRTWNIFKKKRIWQWIEYLHSQMYWWFRPSGIVFFLWYLMFLVEKKVAALDDMPIWLPTIMTLIYDFVLFVFPFISHSPIFL